MRNEFDFGTVKVLCVSFFSLIMTVYSCSKKPKEMLKENSVILLSNQQSEKKCVAHWNFPIIYFCDIFSFFYQFNFHPRKEYFLFYVLLLIYWTVTQSSNFQFLFPIIDIDWVFPIVKYWRYMEALFSRLHKDSVWPSQCQNDRETITIL